MCSCLRTHISKFHKRNVEFKYIQKRPRFFFKSSEWMQRLYHSGPTISILSSGKWSQKFFSFYFFVSQKINDLKLKL